VKVIFKESIADGIKPRRDFTSHLNKDKIVSSLGDKTVRTKQGTSVHSAKKCSSHKTKYKNGRILKEIEVKYCTTLGLISAGVILKPPLQGFARLKYSAKRHEFNTDDAWKMKKIKISTKCSFDGEVMERKEMDCFDLTVISDSKDDE